MRRYRARDFDSMEAYERVGGLRRRESSVVWRRLTERRWTQGKRSAGASSWIATSSGPSGRGRGREYDDELDVAALAMGLDKWAGGF